jgi:hypothetical protein
VIAESIDVAASVGAAWSAWTRHQKDRGSSGRRGHVWASGWRPCRRAMALDLMHPEDRSFSEESLERFYDGDDWEANTTARLIHAGRLCDPPFVVERAQERFEIKSRRGDVIITGKLDGVVRFPQSSRTVPFECKGGVSVHYIKTLEDFELSPWTRPMPRQLLAYMLAMGLEDGLFVLNRPGKPHFLPVTLREDRCLEMAEEFLQAAEVACDVAAIDGAAMPDYYPLPSECRRCDHRGKSCTPPFDAGQGLVILDDARLVRLAEIRERHAESAREWRTADKVLKDELHGTELVHLGSAFEVRGKWQRRGDDPRGAWRLESVERLGE